MKSELYFARFVAEHNMSFATADHFSKLCKVIFPDSKVAESFLCGRTKTTALVTHALPPSADDTVISACQKQKFSILCDGGNDNFNKYGTRRIFPLKNGPFRLRCTAIAFS